MTLHHYESPFEAVKRVVRAFASDRRRFGGMIPIKDVRRVLPHIRREVVDEMLIAGADAKLWDLGEVNEQRLFRREDGIVIPRPSKEYPDDVSIYALVMT